MTETVVHVTTLEQWKSVLDVLFNQGYKWNFGIKSYHEEYFERGQRFISLIAHGRILQGNDNYAIQQIEYSEFMAKQKGDKEVKTYYVTKEQLDLIEEIKADGLPFFNLVNYTNEKMENLAQEIPDELDKPLLRYIGGDETIDFKIKEQLYRLWATDYYGDKVYFRKNHSFWTAPATQVPEDILTAPLDVIKKWQTPEWTLEEVN